MDLYSKGNIVREFVFSAVNYLAFDIVNFINENFSLLLSRDDEEFMFFSKSAVTTTEPEKWPLSIGDTTLLSHIGNINFSSDFTFL